MGIHIFIPAPAKSMNGRHNRHNQSGAILIVGLIFLIVFTLLGITALQTTALEERMAGNMRDWTVAFQAAEAALRDAEADVLKSDRVQGATGFSDGCNSAAPYVGLCLPSSGTPVWQSVDFSAATPQYVSYGAVTGAAALTGLAVQPKYIIEALPNQRGKSLVVSNNPIAPAGKYIYRITARGYGADAASQVTVQSVYKLP
jgi:type IV pilus assembly protein PilX